MQFAQKIHPRFSDANLGNKQLETKNRSLTFSFTGPDIVIAIRLNDYLSVLTTRRAFAVPSYLIALWLNSAPGGLMYLAEDSPLCYSWHWPVRCTNFSCFQSNRFPSFLTSTNLFLCLTSPVVGEACGNDLLLLQISTIWDAV